MCALPFYSFADARRHVQRMTEATGGCTHLRVLPDPNSLVVLALTIV